MTKAPTEHDHKAWWREVSRRNDIFALLLDRDEGLVASQIALLLDLETAGVTYALKRMIDDGSCRRERHLNVTGANSTTHIWRYWAVTPFEPSVWPQWAGVQVRRPCAILAHRGNYCHKSEQPPLDGADNAPEKPCHPAPTQAACA